MENDQETTAIIRYLKGQMSPEETRAFKARLDADPKLREHFEFHAKVFSATALSFQRRKKQLLKNLEARRGYQRQRSRTFVYSALVTAAAAMVFILVLFFTGKDPQTLANRHFKPFPDHVTKRYRSAAEKDTSTNNLLQAGMQAYYQDAYKKAIVKLEKARNKGKQKATAKFYLANAYLATNKPKAAIPLLKGLGSQLEPPYTPHHQWYLALAYLKLDQPAKAKPLLQALKKHEGFPKRKAAKELLKACS